MRRALVFALCTVPAILWAGLQVWTQGFLARAESLDTPPSLASRALLFVNLRVNRHLLLAILVIVVASPVCSAAIAWAAGTLWEAEPAKSAKALLMWWGVSVASLALFVATARALGTLSLCPLDALEWATFVSYSISIGSAFALQQRRVAAGHSTTKARWLLAAGAWLYWTVWPAAFVVPIGVWLLWRRELRRTRLPAASCTKGETGGS
jgi:hypothetical protein